MISFCARWVPRTFTAILNAFGRPFPGSAWRLLWKTRVIFVGFFFGLQRNYLIDYLTKGKTIIGEFCSNRLTKMDSNFMKTGLVLEKISFYIRTMHLSIETFWRWENWSFCSMKSRNIHFIPQIWHFWTSICYENSNFSSLDNICRPIRKL